MASTSQQQLGIIEWIFLSLFMIVGSLMIFFGVRTYVNGKQSLKWPQENGVITSSKVQVTRNSDNDGNKYTAEITYSFKVDRVQYFGDRIYFGYSRSDSPAPAETLVSQYRKGARVFVSHHPHKPQENVLRPGVHSIWYMVPIGGVFFVFLSFVFMAKSRESAKGPRTKKKHRRKLQAYEQAQVQSSEEQSQNFFRRGLRIAKAKALNLQRILNTSGKDWFILAVFFGIGAGMIWFGGRDFVKGIQSKNWHCRNGEITYKNWVVNSDDDGTTYRVRLSYEFKVSRNTYFGDNIYYGYAGSNIEGHHEKIFHRYNKAQRVSVYYNPENPDENVLEPGFRLGALILPGMGCFLLFLSLYTLKDRFLDIKVVQKRKRKRLQSKRRKRKIKEKTSSDETSKEKTRKYFRKTFG